MAVSGEGPVSTRLLDGCRVVDLSTGLAGPYCGRLLAAAGADVVKVESPAGDPMKRWSPTGPVPAKVDSAMYRFLNAGKRVAREGPGGAGIEELLATADVVIESFVPAQLDIDELREQFPALVVLSVTPFGRTGPWEDRAASDFTADAEGGALGVLGRRDGTPTRIGVRINEYIAGAYAAVAGLAAFRRASAHGVGAHVDLSIAETANASGTNLMPVRYELDGRPDVSEPLRWLEVPGIEPTADGWVGLNTTTRQQFDDLLAMVGRDDLIGDGNWVRRDYRGEHMDEWNEIVRAWTRQQTTADVLELASLFRIPSAPVSDGCTVTEFQQFVARESFGPCAGGSFVAPRPPIRVNGRRLQLSDATTRSGEHPGATRPRHAGADRAAVRDDHLGRPLEGVRVLDATAFWAGPAAGQLLAALGADVIHLESHTRLEGGRTTASGDGEWWERGIVFHHANTGKRSLAVDLTKEAGRDVVRRVLAACDLMLENYSPRVFENFGFDWDMLHALNPRLGLVRLPAFGIDGPWRDRIGFGQTMEQATGLAWVTGHPEEETPWVPHGPCDPMAGGHGAFGALLALQHRDLTGEGAFVEVAMADSVLNAAAEPMVEYSAYGRVMHRNGNRTAAAAPQGLYRCRGIEQWLALTVASDADWAALKDVMRHPVWAKNPDYDDLAGRQAGHDAIDRELAAWAADQDVADVVQALVARGVAAGRAIDPRHGVHHPQFRARGLYEELDHPIVGRLAVGAVPFRFSGIDRWWSSAAPTLGQHNHEVLRDVAGFDDEAITELERDGVIGQRPVGIDGDTAAATDDH